MWNSTLDVDIGRRMVPCKGTLLLTRILTFFNRVGPLYFSVFSRFLFRRSFYVPIFVSPVFLHYLLLTTRHQLLPRMWYRTRQRTEDLSVPLGWFFAEVMRVMIIIDEQTVYQWHSLHILPRSPHDYVPIIAFRWRVAAAGAGGERDHVQAHAEYVCMYNQRCIRGNSRVTCSVTDTKLLFSRPSVLYSVFTGIINVRKRNRAPVHYCDNPDVIFDKNNSISCLFDICLFDGKGFYWQAMKRSLFIHRLISYGRNHGITFSRCDNC